MGSSFKSGIMNPFIKKHTQYKKESFSSLPSQISRQMFAPSPYDNFASHAASSTVPPNLYFTTLQMSKAHHFQVYRAVLFLRTIELRPELA